MSLLAYASAEDSIKAISFVGPTILVPFLALVLAVASKKPTSLSAALGLFSGAIHLWIIGLIVNCSPPGSVFPQLLFPVFFLLVSATAVGITWRRRRTLSHEIGGQLPELAGLHDKWERDRPFSRASTEAALRKQGIQEESKDPF